jgi:hypothetical protein
MARHRKSPHRSRPSAFVLALGLGAASLLLVASAPARAQNAIQVENALPGAPQAQWDVSGAGDLSIQGFATDISVNRGETVRFKIKTDAASYHVDIYRLGYYGGLGARLQGTGVVTATLPQAQPADLHDPVTGLTDCGNWAESAHWDVPAGAVSGIYLARLVREDTQGASHIAFVVRDDASTSDLLFQTSDATWQAYNLYGGNSLYSGSTAYPAGHAVKVSYNRPFITRGGPLEDWVFNAEYPMVRWLEANGYDVSYTTNVDTDRRGSLIVQHQVFLSVGHDEYWSAGARANVAAARDAGVHLAFLSGNEIYWKTRYEPSTDGSSAPYRTLVCYKEGTLGELACGGKCDPLPDVWTGLWRDGCASSPPADGCAPENALSGQISWDGSTSAIQVPDTYKDLRLWRNTSVALLGAGQTATLGASTLGYEWDFEQYLAAMPTGRVKLSRTFFNGKSHHLSLYRHASGALVFGAGTVQWSWGLDGNHDRGSDPPVPAIQQATVNLLAEMGAQPGSLQPGLVAASPSGDASPPASVIGFPLDGGTVVAGTSITVSGTSADAGGGVPASVEVSVDGGTTWSAATGGGGWTMAWTPSGAGSVNLRVRAVDDWGNRESEGPGITVTVNPAPPPLCPCTAWDPGTVPGTVDGNDGTAIEVGVRFRADVDGVITGVRFYKAPANTGTHLGKLYTNTGTLLASETFTGETASGWQEVTFATPVPITQGTTFVASVWMPAGHYSFAGGYFASAGVDRPPVHLLQDGVDGANGVYNYGSQGFPATTFNSSNYWVDVAFDTEAGPDVTPPSVTGISPGNGASGVAVGTTVTVTFSEAMNAATIDGASFELRDAGNALVASTVSYQAGPRTASLSPAASLTHSSTYTARVTVAVQDLAGNPLASAQQWSFTTAAPPPPPPTEGPGGPILVISAAANPFSRYPVEILRAEGLNSFTAMDLSLVTPAVLAAHDVVVLGECALSAADVTMLSGWIDAGGTLVAFRPDPQLAPLLGLTSAGGTLSNGYLLVDTASGPGMGIVGQTLQFHGTADLYTLSGATAIATLYSTSSTATAHPAVTTRAVGGNGGRALAFTYDLARSVVYTRQGNPAWAGTKRDGQIEPIRSDDLFYGNAAGDPQPDWIDFDRVAIPQADEQQRLLANAILLGVRHRMPMPRLWYLPRGLKAAVVMTGDNHGDGGMSPRFEIYRTQSAPGCSVDDWECVRATGYLYLGGAFTPAQALFYESLGFEVSLHVNTNCARSTPAEYEAFVSGQAAAFAAAYPSLAPLVSNRNHCIAWSDWSSVAEVEAAHGIRFDTNYYYWPASWVQGRAGFFTGSGMPMRFAKLDGSLIDCYQGVTHMPDESGMSFPAFCDVLLDRALGAEGFYGVFTTNMHFDSSPHAGSDAIVASAQARGVPVVSAKQMLTWLDGRNGSSFGGLGWSGNQLAFTVSVGAGARNLRGMLPMQGPQGQLATLTRDGNPVAFTTETIKGIAYGLFPADAGAHVATYLADGAPPVVTNVSATPHPDGTATITWTTDEPSDSQVDFGTSPGSLGTTTGSAAMVTSHSVTLTGLTLAQTYHFRVRSTDAASNMATEPQPPSAPLSLTMPDAPCFVDATATDFAQGTTGAATLVSERADGEVTLAPAVRADFGGVALPAGWTSAPWTGGGTAIVGSGQLQVSGAAAYTLATFGPGRSLEFVATFRGDPFQNIGLAASGAFDSPWITIGTGASGSGVFARSSSLGDVLLSGVLLGTPHRYRIDWGATEFTFHVDGVQVAVLPHVTGGPLVAVASDFNLNGLTLDVDWLVLGPYPGAGSFTSRVFDAGGVASWGIAEWDATVPAGTTLQMFQRQGPTPVPDGSWTAYAAIPSSGAAVGGTSRYLQYRLDLTTADPALTAELEAVRITCTSTPDLSPPVISGIVATPGASGTTADITWATDELADSRVDYGTSPGALTSSASSAALTVAHALALSSLTPSTTYHFRVTSEDASGNPATSPDPPAAPLTFTTPAAPPAVCAEDRTAAHFTAGTHAGTVVSAAGDGEVTLAPSLLETFDGVALPAGWASYDWPFDAGAGTATVAGGTLTVDGARANPDPHASNPGVTLELIATFSGDAFQHVGFGAGSQLPPNEVYNTVPWAMFSTGGGGALRARTHTGGPSEDIVLAGSWLGAPHRFRIEWGATSVTYSIDGAVVHVAALAVAGPMRPAASDLNVGGGTVVVDELSLAPYAAAGTFESRVHDAGTTVAWAALSWTSTTPAGTSLAMSVRTGNTPAPDASWSGWTAVAVSGGSVGATSRYLQVRAQLATTDGAVTPALQDASLTCSPCAGPAPDPIADLAVARQGLSAAPGRRTVLVTFTEPAGASAVEVYRAPFGGHPRYDEAGGSDPLTPAYPPGPPWQLTSITASGQLDDPPGRDQWHYVAFWRNDCSLLSSVSNRPPGVLNYTLGDVSDGITPCAGDNAVGTTDVSLLGAHYGATLTGAEPHACLDMGPTTDRSPASRPTTDLRVQFEDLVMVAMEYGLPIAGPAAATTLRAAAVDDASLVLPGRVAAGETFEVALRVSGTGRVQALTARLAWDAARVRVEGVRSSGWLERQQGLVLSPDAGGVDGAVLGRGRGILGEGVMATWTFRAAADGEPGITLAGIEARDAANRPVPLGSPAPGPPRVTRSGLEAALPNPFADRTTLHFSLAEAGPVDLSIYSVDGRRVRTLAHGTLAAGPQALEWDRRNERGDRVGPGVYLVRLTTRYGRFALKLAVVK